MALEFKRLKGDLQELEEYFPFHHCTNRLVSQASAGWHLAHSFKVINSVCSALKNSKPEDYRSEFSLPRTIVFAFGSFPRGKAKAPGEVIPKEITSENQLFSELETTRRNLGDFASFHQNSHFRHPYFKELNKKQSQRLLEVHTRHHLKIIRDILK